MFTFARYTLAGAMLFAFGCEAAGVASDRITGSTVSAKYVPSKTDKMLVLVESYGLSLDSSIEIQHLTLVLRRTLQDEKIASLVDQDALERLKDSDHGQYEPMTIAEIGRKVGARQVLYVNIWRSEIVKPSGSGQVRGHMDAIVKVVDSATGDTRWPHDAPSEAVQLTTAWIPEGPDKTDNDVRAQMADEMAANIGRLFKDYHPDLEPMQPVSDD